MVREAIRGVEVAGTRNVIESLHETRQEKIMEKKQYISVTGSVWYKQLNDRLLWVDVNIHVSAFSYWTECSK